MPCGTINIVPTLVYERRGSELMVQLPQQRFPSIHTPPHIKTRSMVMNNTKAMGGGTGAVASKEVEDKRTLPNQSH